MSATPTSPTVQLTKMKIAPNAIKPITSQKITKSVMKISKIAKLTTKNSVHIVSPITKSQQMATHAKPKFKTVKPMINSSAKPVSLNTTYPQTT